jgi:methionine synthase II (cobalamin-independent)
VTARATGVGSLPGSDMAEALRFVTGELADFVHLPELPARGAGAGMVARAVALLQGLGADLQPAGWRLTDAPGIDHRRAVSLLGQDLDLLEEHTQGYEGPLKVQVTGPWTLASTMERPLGDRVLADHGARHELAQSLAEGVAMHVADLARRVPGAELVVQVDEPGLPAVLAGRIPTASGFHRHRSVNAAMASAGLRELTGAISSAEARPVVHSCAADLPVPLLVDSGFSAILFDLSLATPADEWAQAWEAGVDLWPGVVPTDEPSEGVSDRPLVERVQRFFDALGVDAEEDSGRLVVTPTCGLAGASPAWSREALRLSRVVAAALAG